MSERSFRLKYKKLIQGEESKKLEYLLKDLE